MCVVAGLGVQDINDVRTIYSELHAAHEKMHYRTKFTKGRWNWPSGT
jgi:hypothetical protein